MDWGQTRRRKRGADTKALFLAAIMAFPHFPLTQNPIFIYLLPTWTNSSRAHHGAWRWYLLMLTANLGLTNFSLFKLYYLDSILPAKKWSLSLLTWFVTVFRKICYLSGKAKGRGISRPCEIHQSFCVVGIIFCVCMWCS